MNIDKTIDGLIKYINTQMMPAMNDWQKLIAAEVIGRSIKRADAIKSKLMDNGFMRALGYIDSDGNVDIGGIVEYLRSYIRQHGNIVIKIPLMPTYKISEPDIDEMLRYIGDSYDIH